MKTEHLIDLLAQGVEPVRPHAARRHLALALGLGLPLSLAIVLFDYGLRPDLAQAALLPMFWVKLLFPALVGLTGFLATQRLARPGVAVGALKAGFVLPIAALWLLAAVVLLAAAPQERPGLVLGSTWRSCAVSIGFIALPVFVAVLGALRTLAPTRPAAAGAAAGALAGGAGAMIYALHCPELQAPFLAVWYVAGIALVVLAGALLGRFVLRW